VAKKKQPSGLSPEAEAKAQEWITAQRETKEAWERVKSLADLSSAPMNIFINLARALLDLRAKLEEHTHARAGDDGCLHGGR
jgi:hypothetical protein